MEIPAEETQRRVQALSAGIRQSGLRVTPQRLAVIREIAASDAHPDVETLYRGIHEHVPTISLDTVYRTVSTLVENGLIDRVTATSGPARYDGNPFPHHHFVCARCGRIEDIHSPELDALDPGEQVAALGDVESVQIQYRGVCAACRNEARLEADQS